ncbi:MAG: hypothetical protein KGL39_52350 [Patescibacteria group bacterium]|nr:hypothetical protein [Patescibacteria group bacterium]
MKTFPTLYKKAATGKIQVWKIWVEVADPIPGLFAQDAARVVNEYGVLDGKMQRAIDVITEGKNIGKVNETTPYEQAVAEAQSEWEKKLKKHYVQSLEEAEAGKVDSTFVQGGVAPMLAHKYDEQGHKIKWPAYVQPKLDGHRCIAVYQDGVCTLWSRTQKPITGVPHIARAVERLMEAKGVEVAVLDGELYNHDYKDKFEELSSFIRSATPKPGHEVVQYWIYDAVDDSLSFEERNAILAMLDDEITEYRTQQAQYLLPRQTPLNVLPTFDCYDEEAMMTCFGVFLAEGYEGAMVRNKSAKYTPKKRSYDLQKVKVMADAEFQIIDIVEGRGAMAGKAIFVCQTGTGEIFNCSIKGTQEQRADYWQNKERYIGKWLTVKYQNISAYGVPRFPVGLRIREDI